MEHPVAVTAALVKQQPDAAPDGMLTSLCASATAVGGRGCGDGILTSLRATATVGEGCADGILTSKTATTATAAVSNTAVTVVRKECVDGSLSCETVSAVTVDGAVDGMLSCETVSAVAVVRKECVDTSLCSSEDGSALPDVVNASASLLLRSAKPGTAMEAESVVNAELQTLRQEVKDREHTHTQQQDQELLNALREQVDRLTQKEQELEQRLQCVCEENLELKENLSSLHTRLTLNEQQSQQHVQQAAEAWREVEIARDRAQYLQQQLEALEEEASMQDSRHGNTSLLSELEHSLDTIGLDREQVTQDLASILQMLLPLTRGPQEPSVTHSHTHTGPQEPAITHSHKHTSPQEPAITHSHTRTGPEEHGVTHLHSHTHHTHTGPQEPDPGHSDLQGMMGQLKGLAQELAQQHTAQQLSGSIVGVGSDQGESAAQIQELKDQVCVLQEESAELRVLQEKCRDQEEQLQQAIKDRDDAISKKTLMEAELVRSKNDMMSLNNQLLEAIQRKLQLSQELEAWQDDIQVILNQQLRTQHQWEQSQRKPLQAPPLSFLRRPRPHRLSTPPPCAPTPTPTTPSPWRDWLKRGK